MANKIKHKETLVQTTIPETEVPKTTYRVIALDLIDDPERPMRTDLTAESVEDLVISIKQVGIIEPLVVKENGGRYQVIAGHRRLTAAHIAKLPDAPCTVVFANKEQTEMLKIHENLYRQDIKPSDEAEHFKYLIEHFKMSPVKIAQMIGKSESYVGDRLAIFNYPPRLRDALDKKQVNFSVAREFSRLDNIDTIHQYLHYAIRNGITQEGARKWVQDYFRSKQTPQVQEQMQYNKDTGLTETEHLSKCIYCREPIKMSEVNVVYLHDQCLNTVNQAPVEESNNHVTPQI